MTLTFASRFSATANTTTFAGNQDTTVNCGSVTAGNMLTVAVTTTKTGTGTAPFTAPTKSSGTATIGTATSIGLAVTSTADTSTVQVWRIDVTGSGTLVLNIQDAVNTYGFGVEVLEWSGQDTTTPIVGAVTQTLTSAGNFSPTTATLGATPATGDYAVAYANWDTNSGSAKASTAGSGFTATNAVIGTSGDFVETLGQSRTSSTSTTVTWPTQSGPTTFSSAGAAFIVKAATGGATAVYVPPVEGARPRLTRLLPFVARRRWAPPPATFQYNAWRPSEPITRPPRPVRVANLPGRQLRIPYPATAQYNSLVPPAKPLGHPPQPVQLKNLPGRRDWAPFPATAQYTALVPAAKPIRLQPVRIVRLPPRATVAFSVAPAVAEAPPFVPSRPLGRPPQPVRLTRLPARTADAPYPATAQYNSLVPPVLGHPPRPARLPVLPARIRTAPPAVTVPVEAPAYVPPTLGHPPRARPAATGVRCRATVLAPIVWTAPVADGRHHLPPHRPHRRRQPGHPSPPPYTAPPAVRVATTIRPVVVRCPARRRTVALAVTGTPPVTSIPGVVCLTVTAPDVALTVAAPDVTLAVTAPKVTLSVGAPDVTLSVTAPDVTLTLSEDC